MITGVRMKIYMNVESFHMCRQLNSLTFLADHVELPFSADVCAKMCEHRYANKGDHMHIQKNTHEANQ